MSGVVKSFKIAKNRNGKNNVIMLQVQITDETDVQSVELMSKDGIDARPPIGSRISIIQVGSAWKMAVGVDDKVEPDASLLAGEKKIYSSDGGIVKAFITWLKNGIINLNGKNDYAVRYNQLKIAFDQLKADHDNHTHPIPVEAKSVNPMGITPVAKPVSASTADISPAKVDNVTVKGLGE